MQRGRKRESGGGRKKREVQKEKEFERCTATKSQKSRHLLWR